MVTDLGKELRKLRIDAGENLLIMAKKLDMSVSYLSAIENGVREIPVDFIEKITSVYHLSENKKKALEIAEANSANKVTISLNATLNEQRQLAYMLSRKLKDLSTDDCEKIIKLLEEDAWATAEQKH